MSSRPLSRSQRGYDRLSAVYHGVEWLAFGDQLQVARTALIDELPPWNRLLLLGDGDGRLLERLAQKRAHPLPASSQHGGRGEITSVDQSAAMLRHQRERMRACGSHVGVRFIQADARCYEPEPDAYDVMVTPFFLDCFSAEVLDVRLPQWLRGLRPGGTLYHVDFIQADGNIPQSVWQRWRACSLLWAMHVFFRWQTGLENRQLVDTEAAIRCCGLRKKSEQIGGGGLITTQVWESPV